MKKLRKKLQEKKQKKKMKTHQNNPSAKRSQDEKKEVTDAISLKSARQRLIKTSLQQNSSTSFTDNENDLEKDELQYSFSRFEARDFDSTLDPKNSKSLQDIEKIPYAGTPSQQSLSVSELIQLHD